MRHSISSIPVIVLFAIFAFVSCSKPQGDTPSSIPVLNVSESKVTLDKDGSKIEIAFIATVDWNVSTNADWLILSATSGSGKIGSQSISVSASKNEGAYRIASLVFSIPSKSVNVTVRQEEGDGIATLTVSDFLKTNPGLDRWYRVNAEIASIANYQYGNFYVADETGALYVYGLTKSKSETNDQTFAELGLKVGDKLSFIARHTYYEGKKIHEAGGNVPAYYESHEEGSYAGTKAPSTKAAWMELPETKDNDGKDILVQYVYDSSKPKNRSYSTYYDSANMISLWQAYYLCKGVIGFGSRTDAYGYNPLVDPDKQASLHNSSFKIGSGKAYIRGHMVPSAARLSYRENIEVFYDTNIMPQDESFNVGSWSILEGRTRQWFKNCDTLYIVVGADYNGSKEYVLDNDSKKITVPVGCYQAILKYSTSDGYSGAGFYFENSGNGAKMDIKSASMSIDELEKKMGIDFFVNLPGAVGKENADAVEAEDPKTVDFWWK